MKRLPVFLTACLLLASLPALAAGTFPDIDLQGEISPEHRAYLGVADGPFKVSDIKAEVLVVEVFSMYCPICQREAHDVNALYERIVAEDKAGKVKFIGLAAGNTPFEVGFYRNKYSVPFPLFEDPDYLAHKAVGNVGTPAYYLLDLRSGRNDILVFHEGEMPDKEGFLKTVLDHAGR